MRAAGAAVLVDPRDVAEPEISAVYQQYPHIGPVLPAAGYNAEQLAALEATINAVAAEVLVSASPIELRRLLHVGMPVVRARHDFADAGERTLGSLVDAFLAAQGR